MAALTTYELDLGWEPDQDYINSQQGMHYLAWRIGVNENNNTGIWIIEPVIDDPEPLENLLPVAIVERPLTTDTQTTGHARTFMTESTISEVQAEFSSTLATHIAAAE